MDSLDQILTSSLARTPAMQVQDLYKLLHLAAFGSVHAISDEQSARDWLDREINEMGSVPDDPLVEPLSPDGQILRVNIRPYVREGRDKEALLRSFILTANHWHGSLEKLKEFGRIAGELAVKGVLPFSGDEVLGFFASMEAQGFPAVHHSEVYEELYHPAYRVVAREFLEQE